MINGQKILIVDDDRKITLLLTSVFEQDFDVFVAENGKLALEHIMKSAPDIVISDVIMPEMDGFELCKQIKQNPKTAHIPVVLLTARNDVESELEGLTYGADRYIPKPFHIEILKKTVKNMLETQKRAVTYLGWDSDVLSHENTSYEQVFKHFKDLVNKNLSDAELSVTQIVSALHISPKKLQRVVKQQTGISPKSYIIRKKLGVAKKLLENSNKTVSEAAYSAGFNNLSHFSVYFKEEFGYLPSEIVRNRTP